MRERGEGQAEAGFPGAEAVEGLSVRRSPVQRSGLLLGVCSLLAALAGCNGSASADGHARVAVQTESAKTEQVVQRIEPAAGSAGVAVASTAPAPATTIPQQTTPQKTPAPSATGAATASGSKAPASRAGADPITAKHVEAELNRLEAELE